MACITCATDDARPLDSECYDSATHVPNALPSADEAGVVATSAHFHLEPGSRLSPVVVVTRELPAAPEVEPKQTAPSRPSHNIRLAHFIHPISGGSDAFTGNRSVRLPEDAVTPTLFARPPVRAALLWNDTIWSERTMRSRPVTVGEDLVCDFCYEKALRSFPTRSLRIALHRSAGRFRR